MQLQTPPQPTTLDIYNTPIRRDQVRVTAKGLARLAEAVEKEAA